MEVLNPYIDGLKYLFYTNQNDQKKFSIMKLLFILTYIFSILTGFLSLLNVSKNDLICEASITGTEDCELKINLLGTLFNISSFILLFGAFIIIFYSSYKNNSKNFFTYLSLIISSLVLLSLMFFIIVFITGVEDFNSDFNSIGFALIVFWDLFFEPVLFFTGVLLILDIITQDYELKGFSKKNFLFLFSEILLIAFLGGILFYWLNYTNQDIVIFKWFYNTIINTEGVRIVLAGFQILLLVIVVSVIGFFVLGIIFRKSLRIANLKAILPWIILYALIFFAIQGLPAVFHLDYELKSLTDFLDISLIFIIIFLAILRIVSVPDSKKDISKHILYNPLKWTDYMPKYAKILLLLFLNTEIFYQNLQHNAIATLSGAPNIFTTLKAVSLVSFIVVGFISVYFRYKPHDLLTETLGPIKFFRSEFSNLINKRKK